jgi:O-antigen ligase
MEFLARLQRPFQFASAVFFALLLPAAAVGGGMALPALISLFALLSIRPALLRQACETRPLAIALLLAFTAWAATSAFWSPWSNHSQALKLVLLVPLGLLFAAAANRNEADRRLVRWASLLGFMLMIPALAIEALWQMPINRAFQPDTPLGELGRNLSRAGTYLLAISWPVAAGLIATRWRFRWLLAGALIGASGALTLPFGQFADVVAFGLGLLVFAAAFALPRLTLLLTSGALALWMLIAPFATPLLIGNQRLIDALPLSWAARVGIWRYVCARILEQPWIGHGLDASRAVADRIQVRELNMRAVPLHPHSASLQIWFETGAAGAVLAAASAMAGGVGLSG